ncbi:MAG: DUF1249 domain-containing protein [Pseudomonadales bacterium]
MPHRSKRYRVDLPAQMAECDANYLRLRKLFPRLHDDDVTLFGIALGEHPHEVRIEVIERGPYTTLLQLSLLPEVPWNLRPRLTVRMYHDARSAEVVGFHRSRHFRPVYEYPNPHMHQPDEKAQVNRFLGELLSLCLHHGVAAIEPVLAD